MTNGPATSQPPLEVEELGLKHKSESELLDSLMHADSTWTDDNRAMVQEAYDLAANVHSGDTHRDMPYTYHLLRNANRVSGYLHISDPEIIAAVILHDSVEDHPDEIIHADNEAHIPSSASDTEKQQLAFRALEKIFTPHVSRLVATVTNAPSPEGDISYEDWLNIYVDKVKSAVTTPEGWIVKFVDWEDNGLGIIHGDDSKGAEKLQHWRHKYGLVLAVFEARFTQDDIQKLLDDQAKAYVRHQFDLGRERLDVGERAPA